MDTSSELLPITVTRYYIQSESATTSHKAFLFFIFFTVEHSLHDELK